MCNSSYKFNISGETLFALESGALWWPKQSLLTVSDLHLGKSERISRRGGPILPPYEVVETLSRLQEDIERCGPKTIICLGDSFDDLHASASIGDNEKQWVIRLQAGRKWIWIEGNHDPGPVDFGGTHLAQYQREGLIFTHIATDRTQEEVSGHFHPKYTLRLRGRSITRPCFIYDDRRLILPAYGTYTGGLRTTDPIIQGLFKSNAKIVLTGKTMRAFQLNPSTET